MKRITANRFHSAYVTAQGTPRTRSCNAAPAGAPANDDSVAPLKREVRVEVAPEAFR